MSGYRGWKGLKKPSFLSFLVSADKKITGPTASKTWKRKLQILPYCTPWDKSRASGDPDIGWTVVHATLSYFYSILMPFQKLIHSFKLTHTMPHPVGSYHIVLITMGQVMGCWWSRNWMNCGTHHSTFLLNTHAIPKIDTLIQIDTQNAIPSCPLNTRFEHMDCLLFIPIELKVV